MNTRFNPTTNGNLHIGHIYLLLVNEYTAHASPNGKFSVRFDNTQKQWIEKLGDQQLVYANNTIEILDWLNVTVDDYIFQSDPDLEYSVNAILKKKGFKLEIDYPPYPTHVTPASKDYQYGYTPNFTLEKVVMDYLYGINCLIRGIELMSEFSLYSYFCEALNLPMPLHIYLPRMETSLKGISKTDGGFEVQTFRDRGWTPGLLKEKLRVSCLKNPYGNFDITNIKEHPIWIDSSD